MGTAGYRSAPRAGPARR